MTLEEFTHVWEGDRDMLGVIPLDGQVIARVEIVIDLTGARVSMWNVHTGRWDEIGEVSGGTAVLEGPDEQVTLDDGDTTGTGDWFTIKGRPWSCSCGESKPYMAEDQHPHRIIVWPSEQDPNMLKTLRSIHEDDGEAAEVVRYEKAMGPCVSHYEISPS